MFSNPLFSRLERLMIKYRFKPDRKLSQNFIIDRGTIERAVSSANLSASDTVAEIGAGTGFLTEMLLEKAGKVVAFEIDERLQLLLESEYKDARLSLVKCDFFLSDERKFNKIVCFPPYHLS